MKTIDIAQKTKSLASVRIALGAGASALALGLAAPMQANAQQDGDSASNDSIVVVGSRIQRRGFEDVDQPALVLDGASFENNGYTNVSDALKIQPNMATGIGGLTTGSGQNVGQEFLDMFDLGSQRTLVVVNGRRFVPGNPLSADPSGRVEGSQVDINNFPTALVERIEALSIGGAPIYGADAIAGTVNIVLKRDYEGMDLSYQYDDFQDFSAPEHNVSGVFGANFSDGRGNVTASVQWEKQAGATSNDVPGLVSPRNTFGTDGITKIGEEGRFNILEGPAGYLPAPRAGVPVPFFTANVFTDEDGNILTFAGDGGLSVFDPGVRTGTSAVFGEGGSGFDLTDYREAITPVERFVFTSGARYDVSDNVELFMETNFMRSSSTDLISQTSSAFNTGFLSTQGIGAFGVSIDNPFLSSDDRTTLEDSFARQEAARLAGDAADLADLLADPDADPDDIAALEASILAGPNSLETLYLNGINLGLLPNAGANFVDTQTYRVVGGLRGDLEWSDRIFNWDISMNWGETTQQRSVATIRGDAFYNAVDSLVLDATSLAALNDPDNQAALGETINSVVFNVIRDGQVVEVPTTEAQIGDIICRGFVEAPGPIDRNADPATNNGQPGAAPGNTPTPDNGLAGCTPINLFVGAIPGANSDAAIDFITSDSLSFGSIAQTDFVATFGGELMQLPAGWLMFSLGYERRREFGSLTNGILDDGLSRDPAIASFPRGQVRSNEIFGEVVIPVLNDDVNMGMGFIDRLDFNGAYRWISARGEAENGTQLRGNALSGSVNTYTAGGEMALFDEQLILRGNYTRSVRQPSIVELFSPAAESFDQTGDPCDVTNINDLPGSPRAANCVAAAKALGFTDAAIGTIGGVTGLILAPGDNIFTTPSVNAAIPLGFRGNPDLNYEIGNSYTAGFVLQPNVVPGLTLRADYIRITLSDAITSPDFTFFTESCYDTSLDAPECDNFIRVGEQPATDGSLVGGFDIVRGNSAFINAGVVQLKAIQGQMRYNFDVAEASNFFGMGDGSSDRGEVALGATFYAPLIFRDDSSTAGLDPEGRPANTVGSLGTTSTDFLPELSFIADFNWRYKNFNFFWRTTYDDNVQPCFQRVEGSCDSVPAGAETLQRDVEHDMSLGYQINDNVGIRAGVNNILDNDRTAEQEAFGGAAGAAFLGNVLGRNYFFRLNIRG